MPLPLPNGENSKEWLLVVGPDSTAFAAAAAKLNRDLARCRQVQDEKEREQASAEAMLDYEQALVVGWSFEEPFAPEAVREFLRNAPRVAAQVTHLATDVRHFFGPASPSSTDGQIQSADSETAVVNEQSNG